MLVSVVAKRVFRGLTECQSGPMRGAIARLCRFHSDSGERTGGSDPAVEKNVEILALERWRIQNDGSCLGKRPKGPSATSSPQEILTNMRSNASLLG